MYEPIPQMDPSDFEDVINAGPFPIRFPKSKDMSQLDQNEEWCEVKIENKWIRIRFHDYDEVYKIPGLYETIFYRTLRCNSPNRVTGLLNDVLLELGRSSHELRVLDFGAGNGMAGEALQSYGTRKIVGVDILEEAREATLRDRPWVYEDYFVSDFTKIDEKIEEKLRSYRFNTLLTVAALGFGDIPPLAFANAFSLVEKEGLIAFNIRDEFLKLRGNGDFSQLIHELIDSNTLEINLYKRYQHRLSILGDPLYYVAIVARKLDEIPSSIMKNLKN